MSFPSFFFFNDTATTEIYPLSLHDALPILDVFGGSRCRKAHGAATAQHVGHRLKDGGAVAHYRRRQVGRGDQDRKSTRLNSSHLGISYAVFCLKKKKNKCCEVITGIDQTF